MFSETDCGFYIKHINDALQRDSNNQLRSQDLTLSQIAVLLHLENSPGHALPLKELEKQLQVAQSTAAGITARLEQKGFVEGLGCPQDRRVKMVRITSAGLACCAAAQQQMHQAEEHLLAALNKEERILFASLLKKVSDSMK
ncbi:MAG: MarR family winged helix-turn-helix transcriptional regulator [Faecalibacterium sp.]